MPEPDLIHQQRDLLRRFRQASQQRSQAESAANAALQQAQQTAQAQLAKVSAESEARRAAEVKRAEDTLKEARSQAVAQLKRVRTAQEQAVAQLKRVRTAQEQTAPLLAKVNLQALSSQVQVQPTTLSPSALANEELTKLAALAEKTLPSLGACVSELAMQQQTAANRQRLLRWVAGIAAVLLVVALFAIYSSWQQRQERLQAEATATAVAQQVEATATAIAPLFNRFGLRFVLVPGGEFTMGSPAGVGDDDEQPQHSVTLDAFLIGVTEVSNAQYRPFVEAGGYDPLALWTEAGWAWRQNETVTQPGCWEDANWNGNDQPVVCVSWYEAVAYTRWLSQESGLEVRLPTEAEWEKAARGVDGRSYPWGEQAPNKELANFGENVGKTTAVGSYPLGVSPYGALDMAGNVWEWTSTRYQDYPYNFSDGREELEGDAVRRVVRGGSWDVDPVYLRPALRLGDFPDSRFDDLGVRVVVFAPN